jgi:uncharacterized protein YoxC
MSIALEVALFIACIAFIILVPVIILTLYRIHQVTERLLHVVEGFREETKPLIRSMSATADRLHAVSIAAQDQLHEVDKIVRMVRDWSKRVDRLVGEIGSVVEPPIFAASHRFGLLWAGMRTFVETFLSGNKHHAKLEEEIYERK